MSEFGSSYKGLGEPQRGDASGLRDTFRRAQSGVLPRDLQAWMDEWQTPLDTDLLPEDLTIPVVDEEGPENLGPESPFDPAYENEWQTLVEKPEEDLDIQPHTSSDDQLAREISMNGLPHGMHIESTAKRRRPPRRIL